LEQKFIVQINEFEAFLKALKILDCWWIVKY